MSSPLFRIGTRGSPLALWQAEAVRACLAEAAGTAVERIEIVVIRTTGDAIQDRPLSEAGGKGLFTREIDEALLDRRVDLAVHSAKDLPTALPDGIALSACLPRGDVRDAFVSTDGRTLADMPEGACVGTASLRRAALLLRRRPDLAVRMLRGNVGTRLRKIEAGEFDATLLALAGLRRLGLDGHATELMDVDRFPPALGQGTVAVAAREGPGRVADLLSAIGDPPAMQALACERGFLAELDGSCRMPIAGLAEVRDGQLRFSGLVLSPDGTFEAGISADGAAGDAHAVGAAAGIELRARLPHGFVASLR